MTAISVAVKHMLAAGMPHEAIVSAVEEMEGMTAKARSAGAIRQERYRRNKASRVTVCDDSDTLPSPKRKVSPCTPSKENNPIHPETLGASAPSAPAAPVEADQAEASCDHFEAFWSAYPKREGPNPKKPARTSYDRAVKAGATHDQLLAAVRRLASQHPNPTRFCPQAVTWLNQARFADADALPAKLPDPKAKTDADWTRHLQYARRTNLWWMDWGPMPGDPGSLVPDHLITDYDRNQNFVKRRSA